MPDKGAASAEFRRREFLQKVLSTALVGAVAQTGLELTDPPALRAQSKLTSDAAMQALLDGNQRFRSNKLTSFDEDLDILKNRTVDKQEPFAAILACADSRVPVELVFDQSIGELFVARIAGNFVTPEIIASLEYGVAVLGIKVLVVLGHANCGAVKAAMKADPVPGQISSLYQHLRPGVEKSGGSLEKAIEENAKYQADLLRSSSTVIKEAIKSGKLKVQAAVYDLATGKVTLS
ncbi:MAG TPA: carbonic anhydrase [Candidatus Acidoferrales bacterium]|jgi:carbonic anhydrase|nr:carbonic anhydrase [Candidatus Acidoferrales bacterium]